MTPPPKRPRSRGVTLIELTVVIAMVLTLISVLFIGSSYYKNSADKAACITQIAQFQKAVRAYSNLNGLSEGDSLPSTELLGAGKAFPNTPVCPLANGAYTFTETVPSSSQAYARCAEFDAASGSVDPSKAHNAASLAGW